MGTTEGKVVNDAFRTLGVLNASFTTFEDTITSDLPPGTLTSPYSGKLWVTTSWLGSVVPGFPRKSVQHGCSLKSVPSATAV